MGDGPWRDVATPSGSGCWHRLRARRRRSGIGRCCRRGVTLHTARLVLADGSIRNATISMVEEIEQESRKLADAGCGRDRAGGDGAFVAQGIGYDQKLIRRIE